MNRIKLPGNITPLALDRREGRVPRHGYASIRPAKRWQDALIGGNGTIETKTFGDPEHELILFRHEEMVESDLPDGWIHPPESPKIAGVLPEVRTLLLAGKYAQANDLAFKAVREAGYPDRIGNNRRCEGSALLIDAELDGNLTDYMRSVDFRTGESTVTFRDLSGSWRRDSFVSRPSRIAVIRILPPAGYKGKLRLRLASPSQAAADGTEEYAPRRGVIDLSAEIRSEYRTNEIVVRGTSTAPSLPEAGYCGVFRIVAPDCDVERDNEGVSIRGDSEILVVTALEWSADYASKSKAVEQNLRKLIGDAGVDYDRLLSEHAGWQSPIFDRTTLELASGDDVLLSTEELMVQQQRAEHFSPALIEKIFDMGRYLLLYSHGRTPYVWGHVNINVNLQIASGVQTGLPEMMETYFSWIESLHNEWRKNAENIFGFRGFLASVHPDALNGVLFHMTPVSPHHYWVAGAGWCYQPFWEHYQVTGDRYFALNRIYPALREIAVFFEDYLSLQNSSGRYIFAPSYSPENWPGNLDQRQCAVVNSVMDISVCKEVLTHLLELCETLEIPEPNAPRWRDMLARMPEYLTDDLGALKEWAWADHPERFDHRHLSHLYGAWPGDEIRQDIEPELADAALLANRKRAQGNASIHGIMHRALVAARLRDRFLAGRNLRQVLDQGYLNPGSMMTNHNPYRIYCPDACGSLPVLLVEMLLYSRPGVIELLPALPDGFEVGVMRGVRTRTCVVARELRWDVGGGTVHLDLESAVDQRVEIRGPVRPDAEVLEVHLRAGERWTREFRLESG